MLIALTFAAVLGQGAVTSRQFDLTSQMGQYYPFDYSDKSDGGQTSVTWDKSKPLQWSCTLRAGAQYTYCGYGLQLDADHEATGLDITKFQNITLKLNYRGTGEHLRLLLQSPRPANLAAKVRKDETVPYVVEFDVVQGDNVIHLAKGNLTAEQWWLNAHNLAHDAVPPVPEQIVSVAFSSGSQTPNGRMDVHVQSINFEGVSVSTAQWYLIILGVWLVLTGAFLIYRFLSLRSGYEQRQIRQAEESRVLAEARAAAESASTAKSQFLANMSHELRTPLNAIIGYAQLLNSDDLSDRQLSAVRTIQHSGEHLLTMITDILDIAKVEAGKLELLPAPFDIRACVSSVAQMVRLRAEEKGLGFHVTIHEDVPQNVVADQKRVRQVLINLLGNAVKFTSSGEIRLDVTLVSVVDEDVRLRFEISDTGVGIHDDQRERIFRPFEQVGNAIDRSGGTGLGLSITRKIVEMMGGEIGVTSASGEGSCFHVEAPFPLAAGEDVPAPVDNVVADEAPVSDPVPPMLAPDSATLDQLLAYARSGNLRAIRKEVPAILALGPQFHSFAERLDTLCAAYQSPAVLRLVEKYAEERRAA